MANEMKNEAETVTGTTSAPQSAFCNSLRSKKFFMRDALPAEASDYIDASNHCWCRVTQQVIGPDGGSVRPDSCISSRSCYSSAFEA
jgi:hypothetical protein